VSLARAGCIFLVCVKIRLVMDKLYIFFVLTVVTVKDAVFSVLTPCSFDVFRRFGGIYHHNFQVKE
jgi:hypothetical protein